MSFCKDCITGVRFEGTAEGTRLPAEICFIGSPFTSLGKIEEFGGVRCYVATPTVDYPKDKVVLLLTDVFGIDLINPQV